MKDRIQMAVLLLEDQPLIAMDTEAMLRRAGFMRIVPFTSIGPALDWLATSTPDLVIMEIKLQNEPCTALAEQLAARNVPFLVYTGASRRMVDDPVFERAEWISKPSEVELIDAAISRVLGSA